jgi:hypothetical protein
VPGKAASSVTAFLAHLPTQRRRELERVRSVVRKHLPAGYEETLTRGMIVYEVPLRRYRDTYNGHPLWYAALASQKGYLSLHLMPVYGSATLAERLRDGFKAAGKKLNMGKACIRFRSAQDLALDTIGEVIASTSVDRFVASAQAARRR